MAKYAANNILGGTQQNLSSSFKTLLYVVATTGATTLRRGWLYDLEVGLDGAPNATDCSVVWSVDRTTADGTGTAIVAAPLETNDAAALLTYKANYTSEPTVTAATTLLTLALNQRASQRWVARDDTDALVVPATNLAGLVARAKSATYASTAIAHAYVKE